MNSYIVLSYVFSVSLLGSISVCVHDKIVPKNLANIAWRPHLVLPRKTQAPIYRKLAKLGALWYSWHMEWTLESSSPTKLSCSQAYGKILNFYYFPYIRLDRGDPGCSMCVQSEQFNMTFFYTQTVYNIWMKHHQQLKF